MNFWVRSNYAVASTEIMSTTDRIVHFAFVETVSAGFNNVVRSCAPERYEPKKT